MRVPMVFAAVCVLLCGASATALADPAGGVPVPLSSCSAAAQRESPWAVDFSPGAPIVVAPAPLRLLAGAQAPPARRPVPVEYSDGYKTRAKIHKISSFATLPLFVANYFVGQDLYNHPGDESMKGAHGALVAG